MKVSELIDKLKEMPQDAIVMHLWDGDPRTELQFVYLAKNGYVITSDFDEICYSEYNTPLDYLGTIEEYYKTPKQ